MNYYLLFGQFEENEGSFTSEEPWDQVLDFYHSKPKLLMKPAIINVDKYYSERAMSDFLKKGIGKLASKKVLKVFFENGFTGIQFVPVVVRNITIHTQFAFMNATAHYDLLDPIASVAEKYRDCLNGYTRVLNEIIDKKKLIKTKIKHDCFTLSTYKTPYYVNENVKNALEAASVTGIKFLPMEFSS